MSRFIPSVAAALVLVALVPTMASAHPGHDSAQGFFAGATHPLTGLDHLCAMLVVGIWAAQCGGRAVWLVPLSFVLMMLVGGVLAISGVRLLLVEPGIAASLVVLGLLVATATRLPLAASASIVGLFAVAHGFAHGAELPASASALSYIAGFALATTSLLVLGAALGLLSKRLETLHWTRVAGAAIAVMGVVVAFR